MAQSPKAKLSLRRGHVGIMWDGQCFKWFQDLNDSILCFSFFHCFLWENQERHHKKTVRQTLSFDASSLVPVSFLLCLEKLTSPNDWTGVSRGGDSSAEGCAADSSLISCLCCDSGRWIRRFLGWSTLWRWLVRQFKISSRVCRRFKRQVRPLLRFWKIDPSSLVTWGDAADGGDSSAVQDQLRSVVV